MSECILVVEPDLAVRHPLAEYLRGCGFRVFEAVDSDEARAVLQDPRATISIVLVDVDCPGELNGFQLSSWIRDQALTAEVLLAGSLERLAEKAGDLCKEAATVHSPYSHEVLLQTIKGMIARRERAPR
jgi:DNA-binding response OmpR family regulator